MANAGGQDGGPRPQAPRAQGPKAPKAKRTPLQAVLYWGLVAGVWGAIFMVAFLVVFARGLPDTSRLYDIQRQPSITYLDRSGAVIANRGSQYAPCLLYTSDAADD